MSFNTPRENLLNLNSQMDISNLWREDNCIFSEHVQIRQLARCRISPKSLKCDRNSLMCIHACVSLNKTMLCDKTILARGRNYVRRRLGFALRL